MANKLEARIRRLEEMLARMGGADVQTIIITYFSGQNGQIERCPESAYRAMDGTEIIRRNGESDKEFENRAEAEAIKRGAVRNGVCILIPCGLN